jgi:pSer/pThr/pTyr-binding forkhead associated (FHA) protein
MITSDIVNLDSQELPTTSTSILNEFYKQLKKGEIALTIKGDEQLIYLSPDREYTLGRHTEGQSIFPDIDLTPHQAHKLGVSRLHAILRISENKVKIKDLGSVNNTFINRKQIPPKKYITIQHGDTITLGKLEILILIRES